MKKHNYHIRILHCIHAALLACLLLPAVDSIAQVPQSPASTEISSQPIQQSPVRIENVIHVIGLDDKPGGAGEMVIDERAMTLRVHGHSSAVPLRSILAFSVVHDDKALISGTKGKLAQAAPYGIGFAVTMSRPTAETLTLFYRDSDGAIHGCVLVLPKDTEERVVSSLAAQLSPTDYPKTGNLISPETHHNPEIQITLTSRPTKPSVEVALPSASAGGIPSAFAAAVYENLIDQLTQSRLFDHVWREGDIGRAPDAMVLHVDIENWKKGSARGRGFGPFTGTTRIRSNITLVDASGRTVFQGKVDGTKRTNGENIEVTNSLAKHVQKAMEKIPDLQPNK